METNYTLIAKNIKAKKELDLTCLPTVLDIINDIITKDYEWWNSQGRIQQGLERNNLILKISSRIKIPAEVIDEALDELEADQKVMKMFDGKFYRYIKCPNLPNRP